jgi:hypothetical protein
LLCKKNVIVQEFDGYYTNPYNIDFKDFKEDSTMLNYSKTGTEEIPPNSKILLSYKNHKGYKGAYDQFRRQLSYFKPNDNFVLLIIMKKKEKERCEFNLEEAITFDKDLVDKCSQILIYTVEGVNFLKYKIGCKVNTGEEIGLIKSDIREINKNISSIRKLVLFTANVALLGAEKSLEIVGKDNIEEADIEFLNQKIKRAIEEKVKPDEEEELAIPKKKKKI